MDADIAVIDGGGIWVGRQNAIPPVPELVLFKSPQTGITLSLPADSCTVEAVKEKILVSNGLMGFKKKLLRVVYEIDKLIEETK